MKEIKLSGESLDILNGNISKLKELFPEILTEDKIDFDKFKTVFGEEFEDSLERYNFTWKGKFNALHLAQSPSSGTLRPCKEESKNWDTTKNLYIEGDNLEVLKLLQKSYYGKIKMIYIDPPYNTGKEFVYPDDYQDNLQNYLEITGQVSSDGTKLSTNTDAGGRFHTNWLNMIYPRLRLARNLLTDDGFIFISIDDNELENLKKICNEIFGEDNFVSQIIIRSNPGGRDYGGIALTHDYLICYSKFTNTELNLILDKDKKFQYKDEISGFDVRELRNRNIRFNIDNRPNLCYPFYVNKNNIDANGLYEISLENNEGYLEVYPLVSQGVQTVWRWGKEKSKKNLNVNLKAKLKKDGNFQIVEKYRNKFKRERSIWDEKSVRNEAGSLDIKSLFNGKPFDYPKSVELIKRIVALGSSKNSLVMDFFSGSATTAEAVMRSNLQDDGNRKFIMVQLPEPTNEKDEAYKAGFKNIAEIGKERIRRAGDKIVSEMNQNGQTSLDSKSNTYLDIGFKVFKLDSSNLSKWDPEYDNLEQTLLDSVENLVPGRNELDLVYEIMLKYGIDLTLPIEEYQIQDKKFYSIGFGALIICLDDNLTSDLASEIIKLKDELSPEVMRVVFKDNGFASDSDKTNIKETLKTNGIEEFVTI